MPCGRARPCSGGEPRHDGGFCSTRSCRTFPGMAIGDFAELLGYHALLLIRGRFRAVHQTDETIDFDIAENITSSVTHVGRTTGHPITAPLGHDAGIEAVVLEIGDEVGRDRKGLGAGTELENPCAMTKECGDADWMASTAPPRSSKRGLCGRRPLVSKTPAFPSPRPRFRGRSRGIRAAAPARARRAANERGQDQTRKPHFRGQ